jgi:hypothetical protein
MAAKITPAIFQSRYQIRATTATTDAHAIPFRIATAFPWSAASALARSV